MSLPRPPPSSPSPCAVSTLRPCPSVFPVTRGVTPRLCPPPAGDFIHLTLSTSPCSWFLRLQVPVLTSPITGLFHLHATQKPPACRSEAVPLPLPTRRHLPPNWAPRSHVCLWLLLLHHSPCPLSSLMALTWPAPCCPHQPLRPSSLLSTCPQHQSSRNKMSPDICNLQGWKKWSWLCGPCGQPFQVSSSAAR